MKYSAIILDDQSLSSKKLIKYFANDCSPIKIIESPATIQKLVSLSNKFDPDILILDLDDQSCSIPHLLLQLNQKPRLILMSSDQNMSMQAFQLSAVGFILKPFEKFNLDLAVESVVKNIESGKHDRIHYKNLNIVVIPSKDYDDILNLDEVLFLQADGRCTIFHMINNKTFMSYKNFSAYNFLLESGNSFIQISRSYVINIRYLKKVTKKSGLYCELINDITLPISRRMSVNFKYFLNAYK